MRENIFADLVSLRLGKVQERAYSLIPDFHLETFRHPNTKHLVWIGDGE